MHFGFCSEFTACQRLLLNCNKISVEWMGVENMVPSERNQTKKEHVSYDSVFCEIFTRGKSIEGGKQSHGLTGKEEREGGGEWAGGAAGKKLHIWAFFLGGRMF